MAQKRYDQLVQLVHRYRPKSIVEIGVWNGARACQMAAIALTYHDSVHYAGYDLFEEASDLTDKLELNAKPHHSFEQVTAKLTKFQKENPGFTFELHKGDSNKTVPKGLVADFCYIDGGHSVDTIRSDYENTKGSKVVVFDDYYLPMANGTLMWDLDVFGANRIVDAIEGAKVLPSQDFLVGPDRKSQGGCVAIAYVEAQRDLEEAIEATVMQEVYEDESHDAAQLAEDDAAAHESATEPATAESAEDGARG